MHAAEARTIAKVSNDRAGGYASGLLLPAAPGILAMGIVLMIGHDDAPERVPAAAE